MLTNTERSTALKTVLACPDPDAFATTNDRLCGGFPTIEMDDLVSLWRDAGERQLAEAEQLEEYARGRFP